MNYEGENKMKQMRVLNPKPSKYDYIREQITPEEHITECKIYHDRPPMLRVVTIKEPQPWLDSWCELEREDRPIPFNVMTFQCSCGFVFYAFKLESDQVDVL